MRWGVRWGGQVYHWFDDCKLFFCLNGSWSVEQLRIRDDRSGLIDTSPAVTQLCFSCHSCTAALEERHQRHQRHGGAMTTGPCLTSTVTHTHTRVCSIVAVLIRGSHVTSAHSAGTWCRASVPPGGEVETCGALRPHTV